MGYYTKFSANILGDKGQFLRLPQELNDTLEEMSGYDSLFEEPIKWYSYRRDCIEVSKLFPDTIIIITGVGEEDYDLWREYFKDGKFQHVKGVIIYSEFDENKLENY